MATDYPAPMIYDILNTPGTAAEVDVLMRVAHRHLGERKLDGLWLEPACGTGRYLRVLAGRGLQVAGFDRDEAMLAYARRRLATRAARLFPADMTDCREAAAAAGIMAGAVTVAFNPVNSLRHLPDDRGMLAHLETMATLLKPAGCYLVGISLTDYTWLEPEEDLWEGSRGRCKVSQLVNYLPPEPGTPRARTETVVSHLTITRPTGTIHLDQAYDLRTYDEAQWDGLVLRSGLSRRGSFDSTGRPLDGRRLPYQIELLAH